MNSATYLFRIDDVCPTMHWDNWQRLVELFDTYNIQPVIGIVPDNKDPKLVVNAPRQDFWEVMKERIAHGWIVAQHGYQHLYTYSGADLLGLHAGSEFAGASFKEQLEKIKAGKNILEENLGKEISWWMAPGHSFDATTCKALVASGFTYITDGISLYPFKRFGLTWVPQQLWRPESMLFGAWTICLHPNTMKAKDFVRLESFLKKHAAACQNPNLTPRSSLLNPLFTAIWYLAFYLKKVL